MNTVTVNASKSYEIHIGSGLLHELGKTASGITKSRTAAIISDSNVWPIYGQIVKRSLEDANFSTVNFVFEAGEASKNGDTYLSVLTFLAQNQITRGDILIALGGGVVGDLTGFVAATYLRGISYIQVPTSLLAMVDSSVGGKTAIDLPVGKNLVGSFYQPSAVVCDIDTLNTLPDDVFTDGCAEVIKYGILFDETLFDSLLTTGQAFDRERVITRCVELKRDVVMQDEYDHGERQKLNLGHTIGHAVESHSSFTVTHGKAVAIGMAIVAKAACAYGICDNDTLLSIRNILSKFHLPNAADYTAKQLYTAALSDKKRQAETVSLIVPEIIGQCQIRKTPIDELEAFIQAGL